MSSEVSIKAGANLIRSRKTVRIAIELLDKAIGYTMDQEMYEGKLPYPMIWDREGVDEQLRAEGKNFYRVVYSAMNELDTLFGREVLPGESE